MLLWEEAEPHKAWGLAQGPVDAIKADRALQCSEWLVLLKSLQLGTPPGHATTSPSFFYLYDSKKILTRVNTHVLR